MSSGLAYKDLPRIPEPRVRKKSRYSIVIISDSGVSRQVDITRFRMWTALAFLAGVVALVVYSMSGLRVSGVTDAGLAADKDMLSAKVRTLEEELRKKEVEFTVREKRLQESMESRPSAAATPPPAVAEPSPSASRPKPSSPLDVEGPLASLSERSTAYGATPLPAERSEDEPDERTSALIGPGDRQEPPSGRSPAADTPRDEGEQRPPATVSPAFDAQEVTAVAEGSNKGKLRFRLVKDHPTHTFSGYLFVFVEMIDKKGERIIYASPERTRLGDGDLPMDFHAGKALTFKFRSLVELRYNDPRVGATLARISILLYGEDGSIVFQRGFDRGEVKVVSEKATKVDGTPAKKRQAL